MNPNVHTEPYNEGYKDALNGHPIESNPYVLRKNRAGYERGHRAGQKELARQKAAQEQAK